MRSKEKISWLVGLLFGLALTLWMWVGPAILASAQEDADLYRKGWPIIRVIDADTYVALYEGVGTTIRLAEVDAPEGRADKGGQARRFVVNLIEGRYVQLHPIDPTGRARDEYGRMVCRVMVDDTDVATALLDQGFAVPLNPQ